MDELNELKNLVMQNLEKNGYLCNIRALIRASVFKTIDAQDTASKKTSAFFNENAKVQRLAETPQGQEALQLVQELMTFYDMEHSLKIFAMEANLKAEPKRTALAEAFAVTPAKEEPVLYRIFAKYSQSKQKKPAPKNVEKAAELPVQMQKPEPQPGQSQEEIEEDISRNGSKKFGAQSEEFGQSQGYDVTVDSLQLEDYEYYEEIQ